MSEAIDQDSEVEAEDDEKIASVGTIGRFLRWWGLTLRSMLPHQIAVWLGLARDRILLVPEKQGFLLQHMRGRQMTTIGLVSKSSPETANQKLLTVLADQLEQGAEAVLSLPADMGLQRLAEMDAASLKKGRRAFDDEIERQTPFAPDKVDFGYAVTGKADARGKVPVAFTVIPTAAVEEVLAAAAWFDIHPHRVSVSDNSQRGRTVRRIHAPGGAASFGLKFAVCLLAVLALGSPFLRNYVATSDSLEKVAEMRLELGPEGLQQATSNAPQDRFASLIAQRNARPPVVAILEAVTRVMPDTAYLAQLQLEGNMLQVQGVARSASDLIAPLEALPMVVSAAFAAPVLRDPATRNEQFQLTIELASGTPSEVEPE